MSEEIAVYGLTSISDSAGISAESRVWNHQTVQHPVIVPRASGRISKTACQDRFGGRLFDFLDFERIHAGDFGPGAVDKTKRAARIRTVVAMITDPLDWISGTNNPLIRALGTHITLAEQKKIAEIGSAVFVKRRRRSAPYGNYAIIVVGITEMPQSALLQIVHTIGFARLFTGFVQGRQKQSREDSNDGDDYEEFYQRKTALPLE